MNNKGQGGVMVFVIICIAIFLCIFAGLLIGEAVTESQNECKNYCVDINQIFLGNTFDIGFGTNVCRCIDSNITEVKMER